MIKYSSLASLLYGNNEDINQEIRKQLTSNFNNFLFDNFDKNGNQLPYVSETDYVQSFSNHILINSFGYKKYDVSEIDDNLLLNREILIEKLYKIFRYYFLDIYEGFKISTWRNSFNNFINNFKKTNYVNKNDSLDLFDFIINNINDNFLFSKDNEKIIKEKIYDIFLNANLRINLNKNSEFLVEGGRKWKYLNNSKEQEILDNSYFLNYFFNQYYKFYVDNTSHKQISSLISERKTEDLFNEFLNSICNTKLLGRGCWIPPFAVFNPFIWKNYYDNSNQFISGPREAENFIKMNEFGFSIEKATPTKKRTDLVIYLNGLPVVIIEFKKEGVNYESDSIKAAKQLSNRYLTRSNYIFNQLCIVIFFRKSITKYDNLDKSSNSRGVITDKSNYIFNPFLRKLKIHNDKYEFDNVISSRKLMWWPIAFFDKSKREINSSNAENNKDYSDYNHLYNWEESVNRYSFFGVDYMSKNFASESSVLLSMRSFQIFSILEPFTLLDYFYSIFFIRQTYKKNELIEQNKILPRAQQYYTSTSLTMHMHNEKRKLNDDRNFFGYTIYHAQGSGKTFLAADIIRRLQNTAAMWHNDKEEDKYFAFHAHKHHLLKEFEKSYDYIVESLPFSFLISRNYRNIKEIEQFYFKKKKTSEDPKSNEIYVKTLQAQRSKASDLKYLKTPKLKFTKAVIISDEIHASNDSEKKTLTSLADILNNLFKKNNNKKNINYIGFTGTPTTAVSNKFNFGSIFSWYTQDDSVHTSNTVKLLLEENNSFLNSSIINFPKYAYKTQLPDNSDDSKTREFIKSEYQQKNLQLLINAELKIGINKYHEDFHVGFMKIMNSLSKALTLLDIFIDNQSNLRITDDNKIAKTMIGISNTKQENVLVLSFMKYFFSNLDDLANDNHDSPINPLYKLVIGLKIKLNTKKGGLDNKNNFINFFTLNNRQSLIIDNEYQNIDMIFDNKNFFLNLINKYKKFKQRQLNDQFRDLKYQIENTRIMTSIKMLEVRKGDVTENRGKISSEQITEIGLFSHIFNQSKTILDQIYNFFLNNNKNNILLLNSNFFDHDKFVFSFEESKFALKNITKFLNSEIIDKHYQEIIEENYDFEDIQRKFSKVGNDNKIIFTVDRLKEGYDVKDLKYVISNIPRAINEGEKEKQEYPKLFQFFGRASRLHGDKKNGVIIPIFNFDIAKDIKYIQKISNLSENVKKQNIFNYKKLNTSLNFDLVRRTLWSNLKNYFDQSNSGNPNIESIASENLLLELKKMKEMIRSIPNAFAQLYIINNYSLYDNSLRKQNNIDIEKNIDNFLDINFFIRKNNNNKIQRFLKATNIRKITPWKLILDIFPQSNEYMFKAKKHSINRDNFLSYGNLEKKIKNIFIKSNNDFILNQEPTNIRNLTELIENSSEYWINLIASRKDLIEELISSFESSLLDIKSNKFFNNYQVVGSFIESSKFFMDNIYHNYITNTLIKYSKSDLKLFLSFSTKLDSIMNLKISILFKETISVLKKYSRNDSKYLNDFKSLIKNFLLSIQTILETFGKSIDGVIRNYTDDNFTVQKSSYIDQIDDSISEKDTSDVLENQEWRDLISLCLNAKNSKNIPQEYQTQIDYYSDILNRDTKDDTDCLFPFRRDYFQSLSITEHNTFNLNSIIDEIYKQFYNLSSELQPSANPENNLHGILSLNKKFLQQVLNSVFKSNINNGILKQVNLGSDSNSLIIDSYAFIKNKLHFLFAYINPLRIKKDIKFKNLENFGIKVIDNVEFRDISKVYYYSYRIYILGIKKLISELKEVLVDSKIYSKMIRYISKNIYSPLKFNYFKFLQAFQSIKNTYETQGKEKITLDSVIYNYLFCEYYFFFFNCLISNKNQDIKFFTKLELLEIEKFIIRNKIQKHFFKTFKIINNKIIDKTLANYFIDLHKQKNHANIIDINKNWNLNIESNSISSQNININFNLTLDDDVYDVKFSDKKFSSNFFNFTKQRESLEKMIDANEESNFITKSSNKLKRHQKKLFNTNLLIKSNNLDWPSLLVNINFRNKNFITGIKNFDNIEMQLLYQTLAYFGFNNWKELILFITSTETEDKNFELKSDYFHFWSILNIDRKRIIDEMSLEK